MRRKASTAIFTFLPLVLFFVYSCSPLNKYKESVKGWEADIRSFEHQDSITRYPDDAILFMGSSSIRLWSTLQEDMKPYHTIQRGFGGSKISDVAWYTPRIVYPHKVQAVVIFVANDITGSDEDKTPQEIAGLFNNIVKTIRRKLPAVPIFYIEVTPTESRWKVWPQIRQGNELVKKQCERMHDVYFIDASQHFLNAEGKPNAALFRADKLHLNSAGYKVWTGVIKKKLDEVLRNRS
jgi:lysophospholipase L1-like esterase